MATYARDPELQAEQSAQQNLRHPVVSSTAGALPYSPSAVVIAAEEEASAVVTGIPTAYAYVGIPVEAEYVPLLDGTSSSAGHESSAQTNEGVSHQCRKSETERAKIEARLRVDQEARALEIANMQAKRRDSEGLFMRPHPGNSLEPAAAAGLARAGGKLDFYREEKDFWGNQACPTRAAPRGEKDAHHDCAEKERGNDGGGPGGGRESTASGEGRGGGAKPVEGGEGGSGGTGYNIPEYTPVDYDVQDYKSIYDS